MTSRPALLFCDVDRTLLTHDHCLLPEVVQAVARAKAAGLRVVLATARSPAGVAGVLAELGLEGPTICFNGAWIGTPGTDAPYLATPLSVGLALRVAQVAAASGLAVLWYGAEVVFATEADARVAQEQVAVTGDRLVTLPGFENLSEAPYKLMLVAAPERLASAFAMLCDSCGKLASVTISGPGLIEVTRLTVGKAAAAARLSANLGLIAAECAAAGDSGNDIEMLHWAGLAVSVANGTDDARRVARFVGLSCDEGGLAGAIDWLLSLPPPRTPQRPSSVCGQMNL